MEIDNYKLLLFDYFYKVNDKSQILDEFGNVCFQLRDQDHFSRCGEKIMRNKVNLNLINQTILIFFDFNNYHKVLS